MWRSAAAWHLNAICIFPEEWKHLEQMFRTDPWALAGKNARMRTAAQHHLQRQDQLDTTNVINICWKINTVCETMLNGLFTNSIVARLLLCAEFLRRFTADRHSRRLCEPRKGT
jgi:hypothetical protein